MKRFVCKMGLYLLAAAILWLASLLWFALFGVAAYSLFMVKETGNLSWLLLLGVSPLMGLFATKVIEKGVEVWYDANYY